MFVIMCIYVLMAYFLYDRHFMRGLLMVASCMCERSASKKQNSCQNDCYRFSRICKTLPHAPEIVARPRKCQPMLAKT